IGAPHAGGGVDQLAAVDGEVVHVLGAREQPRRFLERAVGGERHPVRGEVVGDGDGRFVRALVQHGRPLLRVVGAYGWITGYQFPRSREMRTAVIFPRNWVAYRSDAAIQNTSPSESSVSSQSSGNCGKAASRLSRPRPISQSSPPCGARCALAS